MSDSKPVDVLAVMDEAAADLDCQCGHPRCGRQRERARMLDARAAVAELIEAAWKFPEDPNPYTYRMAYARLHAALANCAPAKGDAP